MQRDEDIVNEKEMEQPKPLGILIHSFFVLPFIIAVFSVLLVTGIKILTADGKDVYSYLNDIKVGGKTKRWQSAFELSKILKDPRRVPKDQSFIKEMITLFEDSKRDDPRVREYLALAMGCTKNKEYLKPLRKALEEKKDASRIFFIHALGVLKEQSITRLFKDIFSNASGEEKLTIVSAWGEFGDPQSVQFLIEALKDTDPNVRWETAVSLAKCGKNEGKSILSLMLNRSYWGQFKNVDKNEKNHAIITAIYAAALLSDKDLNQKIFELSQKDRNLKVRRVAKSILLKQNKI